MKIGFWPIFMLVLKLKTWKNPFARRVKINIFCYNLRVDNIKIMSERLGEVAWPALARGAAKITKSKEVFHAGGFQEVGRYFLRAMDAKINYKHEADPEFTDDRAKLKSEPGVIICNHPGYVEIPAILQTLGRDDVKIMITKTLYESFCENFGAKYFISNDDSRENLAENFKQITAHIQAGGVFLIFPTGGRAESEDADFKAGFRFLLKRLAPTDMIYSFHVDEEQSKTLREHRVKPLISLLTDKLTNSLRSEAEPKFTVDIDERYSQAGRWQELIKSVPNGAADKLLSQKFRQQFQSPEEVS